jgi:hypothetical protein
MTLIKLFYATIAMICYFRYINDMSKEGWFRSLVLVGMVILVLR